MAPEELAQYENQVLNPAWRRQRIDEILSNENQNRKQEARKRRKIMDGNLYEYLIEELMKRYKYETINNMRVCASINIVERVIDEKASVYNTPPKRVWDQSLSEEQQMLLDDIYSNAEANLYLKKSNKTLELQDQGCLQVLPLEGKLSVRSLSPEFYDVIPWDYNQEKAMCYIINLQSEARWYSSFKDSTEVHKSRDFQDQKIGDQDDDMRRMMRLTWWSDNYNFITDGYGNVVSDPEKFDNPLGELPFIDVVRKENKNFKFWVQNDSKLIRYQLDLSQDLTDIAEITALQGYAQGVLVATDKPEHFVVGPNKLLFLKLDPNAPETKPTFEFKTPSPDLTGAWDGIIAKGNMFLSSEGLDPGLISSDGEVKSFSSGVERLLAMFSKFEATRADLDLFRNVEEDLYHLFIKWNNVLVGEPIYQSGTVNITIPEDTNVQVEFFKPEAIETKKEKQDRVSQKIELGLMSRVQGLMELDNVDRETATELLLEIEEDEKSLLGGMDVSEGNDQSE